LCPPNPKELEMAVNKKKKYKELKRRFRSVISYLKLEKERKK